MPGTRETYANPGASLSSKGGGDRGGPKRWTGHGPKPARHIPWPEVSIPVSDSMAKLRMKVFKHHISVIEGHHRMLDMIMKHTVPGTGNYKMIHQMVDRASEMLRMFKIASRSFVPPTGDREQVPLGSSSASMYPGYSPADHIYGNAAQEYGTMIAQVRAQGIDFKPPKDAPQYEVGQARGTKKQTLAGIRAARGENVNGGSGSGTDLQVDESTKPKETMKGDAGSAKQSVKQGKLSEEAKPLYVVDVKPTPVNIPGMPPPALKRTSESEVPPRQTETTKSKKLKTKHDGEMPKATAINKVELEDISEEVDARLREKEERRKRKEEKKRKRGTEDSDAVVADSTEPDLDAEKLKKRRKKAKDSSQTTVETPNFSLAEKNSSKKRKLEGSGKESAEPTPESEEVEKRKKKSKKSKDGAFGCEAISKKRYESDEEEVAGKERKKRRKTAKDDGMET